MSREIPVSGVTGLGWFEPGNPANIQLTGSNVEQTLGGVLPAKANLMGISDGTNIRAFQGNLQGTLLASAARTLSTTGPTQTNYNARGAILYLDVTVASGTGGLKVIFVGLDPVTGKVIVLNAVPTAIIAVGTYAYMLYPGATNVAGAASQQLVQSVNNALPRVWYGQVNVSDASSYTYSLGYSLIL